MYVPLIESCCPDGVAVVRPHLVMRRAVDGGAEVLLGGDLDGMDECRTMECLWTLAMRTCLGSVWCV
jgi:hypothetical protein